MKNRKKCGEEKKKLKKNKRKNDPNGIEKFSKDFQTISHLCRSKNIKHTHKKTCVCEKLPIFFCLF